METSGWVEPNQDATDSTWSAAGHQAYQHGVAEPLVGNCNQSATAYADAGESIEVVESSKGAISILQEYVQSSKEFRYPIRRPILQWTFEQQMPDSLNLQFRATVAFMLDGVPHHTVGVWAPSKPAAKRDAAHRALSLLAGSWGEHMLTHQSRLSEQVSTMNNPGQAVEILDNFCRSTPCPLPSWHVSWKGNKCQAFAEILWLDAPHHFVGAAWEHEQDARNDTARRVLWYLGCPGFSRIFQPDPNAPAAVEQEIPAPPENWMNEQHMEAEAVQRMERKTTAVHVQNRLQKEFAKDLKAGEKVWKWSYETDPAEPALYRATVEIPVVGEKFNVSPTFTGDWVKGQRDAQADTCKSVNSFLDDMESASKGNKDRRSTTGGQWGRH
jgi:hypothetical protein